MAWKNDGKGWWWSRSDGSWPANSWEKIDSKWYWFNGSGYAVTGWQTIGGKRYHFADDCHMNWDWEKIDGSWYYFGGVSDGVMRTYWQTIAGNRYYFGKDGKMVTGSQKIGDHQYYFDSSGAMVTGFKKVGDYWYYFDPANGRMKKGWVADNGYRYYLDSSGHMSTGKTKIGDDTYWFNSSGAMITEWFDYRGDRYYLGTNGRMAFGWRKIGSSKYNFGTDGKMKRNTWLTESGSTYLLDAYGAMCVGWADFVKDRYYFDANGVRQSGFVKIDGSWYYFANDGKMKTGWVTHDGNTYYMNPASPVGGKAGAMVTGWQKIDKAWYFFNASGAMVKGWLKRDDRWYYLARDGKMTTGWEKIDGSTYYFDANGVMQTGWLKVGGARYYLESNGALFTNGVKKIDGANYRFDKDGKLVENLTDAAGRKATNLAIKRDGTRLVGTWKLPSEATSDSSVYRYAAESVRWELLGGSRRERLVKLAKNATTHTADLGNFPATIPSGATYRRSSFYPLTDQKLTAVRMTVIGDGVFVRQATQSLSYGFQLPERPTLAWEYDAQNGKMILTIDTPTSATAQRERYDTAYMVEVKRDDGTVVTPVKWTSTTLATLTREFDTSSYIADLSSGKTVVFTAKAYARGIAGDNPSSDKAVTATRALAMPGPPVIKKVTATSTEPTGGISVAVSVGSNTDTVKLQRRHGSGGSWSDVQGAVDNGGCRMLYDSVGAADPVDGEYIYYRLLATKDNLTTYGVPFRADALYRAIAAGGAANIGIVSVEAPKDSGKAKLVIGWTETTAAAATEVSWADDPDAWQSTKAPSTFEFAWEDEESQSQDWDHTATVYVDELEAGKLYYFRARRRFDSGAFTGYAAATATMTAAETDDVTLYAAERVIAGNAFTAYWDYQGPETQTEWHIHPEGNPAVSLASGEDSMGVASVPAAKYEPHIVDGAVSLYVDVSIGGKQVSSNAVTVRVDAVPSCDVACEPVCDAKPFQFEVYTDDPATRVLYTCESAGAVLDLPDGAVVQFAGDVVATDDVGVEWALDGETYAATVELPADALLIDQTGYRLSVRVVDQLTGLSSATASCPFEVAWAHQAGAPSDDIEIEADAESLTAEIRLAAFDGAAEGDRYDLYRGSRDGYVEIARGLSPDATVVDRWPSLGEGRRYAVCTRTVDGDTEWKEFPYDLPFDGVVFDWAGGRARVAHSIGLSDAYAKHFEARTHMDGSTEGYWSRGVARSGSIRAVGVKEYERSGVEAMGLHDGPVYIRTPEGSAMQCDVKVTRDTDLTSMVESFSIAYQEVELTGAFRPGDDDITEA